MEDIIEERKLAHLCGWVLCDNPMDPQKICKQTYSIRGHKVFDITERKVRFKKSLKGYLKLAHFAINFYLLDAFCEQIVRKLW